MPLWQGFKKKKKVNDLILVSLMKLRFLRGLLEEIEFLFTSLVSSNKKIKLHQALTYCS